MEGKDIKTIGVVGMGIMGSGISLTAILSGFQVVSLDINEERLNQARNNIIEGRFGLKTSLQRGKVTVEQMEAAISRLSLTTKMGDMWNCDIIIETIGGGHGQLEDKGLKKRVFAELDGIVKKDAIFASNTSFFTIADLATATKRKDRFIGMHWFSPANIMKAIEVIYTEDTSKEIIQAVKDLCEKLGKIPVPVKDIPGDTGFVGNRVFFAALAEAQKIVDNGICTPEGVDTILTSGFNWPVGPFSLIGMTTGNRIQK